MNLKERGEVLKLLKHLASVIEIPTFNVAQFKRVKPEILRWALGIWDKANVISIDFRPKSDEDIDL